MGKLTRQEIGIKTEAGRITEVTYIISGLEILPDDEKKEMIIQQGYALNAALISIETGRLICESHSEVIYRSDGKK